MLVACFPDLEGNVGFWFGFWDVDSARCVEYSFPLDLTILHDPDLLSSAFRCHLTFCQLSPRDEVGALEF